jgi:hypothetical protein
MVPRVYRNGSDVLRSSLSTLVLRIWAAQPIGRGGRNWQSYGVKRTVLRGVGVGDVTRVLSNREHERFGTL